MTFFAGFDERRVDVGGGAIDSGHHMAEDAPEELVSALRPFLGM